MLKCYSTSNSNEVRNINLKQSFLVYILSIVLLISATSTAQNYINKSSDLELLHRKIENNYVPSNWNSSIEQIAINTPIVYCVFLGAAMRNQTFYLQQYPEKSKQFENLHNEIISLMPLFASTYNDANYNDTNYEYIDHKLLAELYYNAYKGEIYPNFDQYYKNKTGKDILEISMPFILEDKSQVLYKKVAKKDKNEINLFGEVAPKAEIEGEYLYSTPSNEEDIPEDILVGTWISKTYAPITFHKNNYGYVGSMSYESKIMTYGTLVKYIVTKTFIITSSEYEGGLFKSRNYKGIYTKKYVPKYPYHDNNKQEDANIYVSFDGVNRYYTSSLMGGSLQGYDKQ